MTLGKLLVVSGVLCLVMVGLYFIAILTPKLADKIDELRGKSPEPYGDTPDPARVEEDVTCEPDPEAESGNDKEN